MFAYTCYYRLQVVSTQVGGVPEVLPPDLIRLAEPTVTGINVLSDTVLYKRHVNRNACMTIVFQH